MARLTKAKIAEITRNIREHIRIHGPKDWALVRSQYGALFPDDAAGERRFFRYVKMAQEAPAPKDAVKKARDVAGKQLPVAPPPSYITAGGATAVKRIDFLGAIGELWEDILNLRHHTFATERDPDAPEGEKRMRIKVDPQTGRPVIQDRHNFDKTIMRRVEIMETALRIRQEIWDLDKVEQMYEEVINIIAEEIVPAEPEIARRVLERIKRLNQSRSMTIHVEPEPEPAGGPEPAAF